MARKHCRGYFNIVFPQRTSVQVVFLLAFNDSSFHLAFDLAVLGNSAWCLGKTGVVSTPLGVGIKWHFWEKVCGWASHADLWLG